MEHILDIKWHQGGIRVVSNGIFAVDTTHAFILQSEYYNVLVVLVALNYKKYFFGENDERKVAR